MTSHALTAVALARDPQGIRALLHDGLGMDVRQHEQEGIGTALTFAAANGAVAVVEPAANGPIAGLLGDAPARWIGTIVGAAPDDVEELVRLADAAGTVRVGIGDGAGTAAVDAPVSIDHVAFAVTDRDAALAQLGGELTTDEPLGRWEFPVLGSATAMVPLQRAYLELNEPFRDESLFAAAANTGDGRPVFVVLRVEDVRAARDRLIAAGHRVADLEDVLARPERSRAEPAPIATVAPIPRREASGLSIMMLQASWPWSGPADAAASSTRTE